MRSGRRLSIFLLVGLLVSCGLPQEAEVDLSTATPDGERTSSLEDLGFDKYLKAPDFHPVLSHASGWDVYQYPVDELSCILGDEYFVYVRKGAEPRKTVFWMAGGGACWPGRDDCIKRPKFHLSIEGAGLASKSEANPVRDWNFVYLPYCDGSIHIGDHDADYDGDGAIDHRHQGLKMTSAAVRLMGELFPETQDILIAGCSAGGGGTLGAAPIIRLAYPEARLYVFNVSGLALVKPDSSDTFETIVDTWNVEGFLPADCGKCRDQFTYFYDWLLTRDPKLKVGVFSSYHDGALRSSWQMTASQTETLLMSTTGAIHENHPETFKRYFVRGDGHCISNYAYSVDGVSIWDWVGYLVNDDPLWVDILEGNP